MSCFSWCLWGTSVLSIGRADVQGLVIVMVSGRFRERIDSNAEFSNLSKKCACEQTQSSMNSRLSVVAVDQIATPRDYHFTGKLQTSLEGSHICCFGHFAILLIARGLCQRSSRSLRDTTTRIYS